MGEKLNYLMDRKEALKRSEMARRRLVKLRLGELESKIQAERQSSRRKLSKKQFP